MNAKDIKDVRDVKVVMEQIETSLTNQTDAVQEIKLALFGKDKDDGGLFADVRNNKRWKGNVNKSLLYLVPVSTGLAMRALWAWVTGR